MASLGPSAPHSTNQRLGVMARLVGVVALFALLGSAEGHGSLIFPLPRNGVDRNVEPFKSGGWPKGHYTCSCTNGTSECIPGQSCLW